MLFSFTEKVYDVPADNPETVIGGVDPVPDMLEGEDIAV